MTSLHCFMLLELCCFFSFDLQKNMRLINVYLWFELFLTIFLALIVILATVNQFLGRDTLRQGFLLLLLIFCKYFYLYNVTLKHKIFFSFIVLKLYLLICVISYYVDIYRQKTRAAYALSLNLATAPPTPIVAQSYMYPHIYYASTS